MSVRFSSPRGAYGESHAAESMHAAQYDQTRCNEARRLTARQLPGRIWGHSATVGPHLCPPPLRVHSCGSAKGSRAVLLLLCVNESRGGTASGERQSARNAPTSGRAAREDARVCQRGAATVREFRFARRASPVRRARVNGTTSDMRWSGSPSGSRRHDACRCALRWHSADTCSPSPEEGGKGKSASLSRWVLIGNHVEVDAQGHVPAALLSAEP